MLTGESACVQGWFDCETFLQDQEHDSPGSVTSLALIPTGSRATTFDPLLVTLTVSQETVPSVCLSGVSSCVALELSCEMVSLLRVRRFGVSLRLSHAIFCWLCLVCRLVGAPLSVSHEIVALVVTVTGVLGEKSAETLPLCRVLPPDALVSATLSETQEIVPLLRLVTLGGVVILAAAVSGSLETVPILLVLRFDILVSMFVHGLVSLSFGGCADVFV